MAVTSHQLKEHFLISVTKKRVLLYFVALLASYVLYYLIDPFSEIWNLYLNDPLGEGLSRFLWMLFFSIITVEICLFVDHKLNRLLPWNTHSKKRIAIQTLLQVLASMVIVLFFDVIFTMVYNGAITNDYSGLITWFAQSIANIILVSLLISGMNTIVFLLENWKKTALEASELNLHQSELRHAATVAELQSLKLQIDPHFIFNNLSALSEIILKDQQLGYEYAENFSEVYRYLLVNSKKNTIALKDELEFLDSYIYMTKKRLEEGVVFVLNIDKSVLAKEIPPMTLQLLVENAIKHNQTSKLNPLIINIFSNSQDEIRVCNTLIPLVNKSISSGVGLHNIVHRFELLGFPKPQIEITPLSYSVIIPLL